MRDTREVIEDHIRRRLEGDVEGDIEHNYAPDVVAVSLESSGIGHDAIRDMADDLARAMPGATFEVDKLILEGRVALEIWSGRSERGLVGDGTDSFVVEDGRITVHTVHFHVLDDGAIG